MASTTYALRVIEGKMRGHVYELPENSEQVVGRGASLDIVVDEDMVSRRHAKLMTFHNEIMVQDLGSTNGTLVNQQRISGAQRLQVGDLVGIGTCVLELIGPSELAAAQQQVAYAPPPPAPAPMSASPSQTMQVFPSAQPPMPPPPAYAPTPQRPPYQQLAPSPYQQPAAPPAYQQQPSPPPYLSTPAPSPMLGAPAPMMGSGGGMNPLSRQPQRPKPEAGSFPSVDAPDVITLVERLLERRHDGVLAVFDPEDREGNIYFRGGHIYFASFEDQGQLSDHPMHPHQSLTRVCGWAQGRFRVKTLNALPSFEGELNEDSRSLIERVRHSCAELKTLRAKLPPLDSRLVVPTPLNAPLSALSHDLLNIFQMCMNNHTIRAVVDFHPQGEREGVQALLHLLELGYLTRV